MNDIIPNLLNKLFKIKGKSMDIKDYKLFYPFFTSKSKRTLLKTGRQTGKSTSSAAKQVLRAAVKPFSFSLTVLPLAAQAYRFSRLYVDSLIHTSEEVKKRVSTKLVYTVYLKQFNNGSELHFSYVGDDPERIRGISVRDIYWDELQSIVLDYLPIVEQCASHFSDSRFYYSGTPLTTENAMEQLWRRTSMSTPHIICSRCRFDNYCTIPEVYKMIKKPGLCCQKCGEILRLEDVYNVQYDILNKEKIGKFEGYHIPQIFVPFNLTQGRWEEIIHDYEHFSQFQFATEVLGISFDTGGRPITLEKLLSLCENYPNGVSIPGNLGSNYVATCMGVDWGYATTRSYTVVTVIGATHDGKYKVLFAKRYEYRDRIQQIEEIVNIYNSFSCSGIGVDHGVGLTDNLFLRKHLGVESVFEYNYCAPNKILSFNKETLLFATNRTKTLSLLFTDLNNGKIKFFKQYEAMPFFNDILAVKEEINSLRDSTHKYYTKNKETPDDFLHSLNFAILTMKLLTKETILCSIIDSNNENNSIMNDFTNNF